MRDIPHSPVALYEAAHLFGTLIAETILASVHVRARKQAGHMGASDLIKALQNTLQGEGRPHTGNPGQDDASVKFACYDGRIPCSPALSSLFQSREFPASPCCTERNSSQPGPDRKNSLPAGDRALPPERRFALELDRVTAIDRDCRAGHEIG